MGRRSNCIFRHRLHTPRPCLQTLFLSAALGLLLGPLTALAQDTAPPPPPPDQPSAPGSPAQLGQPDEPTQTSVRTVRLSDVEGQVQVYQGDQLAFAQAEPNMPAVEGMRLVTGSNGRLEIEFEDGSVARVTPNSSIRLTQLQRRPDGSTVTAIDDLTGLSYYELNGRGDYRVRFGADTATPEGSAVFRVALDSVPNELAVMHGAVHIDDGGTVSVDIHPSQTFQTDPQQGGAFTVAQSVTADSWDQWNSDRDQALSDLESSQTTARASSSEPDNPAWNDLDAYGNWYDVPGYGEAWAPSGVDQSWDPFGNGYWGYYNTFGYTWISGYPWGWWPYHCGAWNFMNGFGWMWIPGGCGWGLRGAGWFPYATVWNVPRGYLPPPRPHNAPRNPRFNPQPLIAINRGPQFAAPFRHLQGPDPNPRPLTFQGRTIYPARAEIHPLEKGPTGESFTTTLVRTHPELATPAMRAAPATGFRTSGAAGQRIYTPSREIRTFGPQVQPAPPHAISPPPAIHSAPPAAPSHPAAGAAPHAAGSPGHR